MKKITFLLCVLMIMSSCKNKHVVANDPVPVYDSLMVASKIINEDRRINVWLPPMYKQTMDSFPVVYMPDGGITEDFPHIANTIAKLISEKQIPPFILVGIENTDRKRDLTGPTTVAYDLQYIPNPGGANNFRNFIKSELFPVIDSVYRTQPTKAIIGESAAGLFVVETFMLHPEIFDYYIAMDPALWFNEQYLVKNFESLSRGQNYQAKKFWFAGSSAEDISKHTRELESKLKNSQFKFNWKYEDEPQEEHHTIFRNTKEKAFIWALNK
ncbi:alpha/beta hydrolase [Imtechella halotolerans]|nr:alpha/beta hydrolase-fold protein [Imtechella halotolerans]WMQ64425.1 alpha/beta hydrolase-fold protein [Imtechella halotolerans]